MPAAYFRSRIKPELHVTNTTTGVVNEPLIEMGDKALSVSADFSKGNWGAHLYVHDITPNMHRTLVLRAAANSWPETLNGERLS